MLAIHEVSKKFGSQTTVNKVSLTVGDGEFLSILGPSGCGKTTLLRLIAGLEKADSGQISLNGQDITHLEPHKRNVHTVFQRYALFPHMNVFDNVAFGLRCKKIPESEIAPKVAEMLELANLQGRAQRTVTTLSGGEQQRVALVRALVNMPKLLLLDEPLGALDFKLRLQLQSELVAIQKRVRTTFVFVTHDQQEALNMSDRVALMNKGEIVQLGTPNEIYEFPRNYFAASFVGSINRMEGTLKAVDSTDGTQGRYACVVDDLGSFYVEPSAENKVDLRRGYLCLRPEKLMVFSRKPTTIDNVVEGTIRSQSYLGTHTQYEVGLKNGSQVSVFQQNTQKLSKKTFQLNEKVFLGWQANLSHFFVQNGNPGNL